MIKAERVYQEKNVPANREAVYEWTMAESYMHKAREEYADSSFEEAEKLANQAIDWILLSEEAAKVNVQEAENEKKEQE